MAFTTDDSHQAAAVSYSAGFLVLSYFVSFIGCATTLELLHRRTSRFGIYNWYKSMFPPYRILAHSFQVSPLDRFLFDGRHWDLVYAFHRQSRSDHTRGSDCLRSNLDRYFLSPPYSGDIACFLHHWYHGDSKSLVDVDCWMHGRMRRMWDALCWATGNFKLSVLLRTLVRDRRSHHRYRGKHHRALDLFLVEDTMD